MRSMKVTAVAVVAGMAGMAQAGTVLVLTDFVGARPQVVAALNAIPGVTAVNQGATDLSSFTLANYSQVWDLRVSTTNIPITLNAILSGPDQAALATYLQGGGRLLLAGEFDDAGTRTARNQSIEAFLDANAGNVDLGGATYSQGGIQGITNQSVTAAATAAGFAPRAGVGVDFSNREFATSVGNGFYVTQDAVTGFGTVVGWDFGDITNAANARMLAYFDSDFRSGVNTPNMNDDAWVQDLWTFLDGSPQVVPLPSAAGLGLVGLTFLGARRRR